MNYKTIFVNSICKQ